jgi:hypothetical protein
MNDPLLPSTYIIRGEINQNLPNAPPNNHPINFSSQHDMSFTPWRPSTELQLLQTEFYNKILYDYPSTPCAYCSILMISTSVKWIDYNPNETYTLTIAFPEIQLPLRQNNRGQTKIAVCSSCKTIKNRKFPPVLSQIPEEINAVPMVYRKYLSPIIMNCSLGRAANSNPYTNYRHLQGFIGLSKNQHALELHSGLVGAFLNQNEPPNWFHQTLVPASQWLKCNNPIFKEYNIKVDNVPQFLPTDPIPRPLPTANFSRNYTQTHSANPNTQQPPSIIVPNNDLPVQIHNEDYKYERLMAGFMKSNDDLTLPISYNNPDIEALLFPDIFTTGYGHYESIKHSLEFKQNTDSYGKYVKLRMLCPDPRFRLHWYWPHWSYLNIEKKRNYQNQNRILRQKNLPRNLHPTKADLISSSVYTNKPIINETITTTLPSHIRTSEPFFKKKQQQVNTMLQAFGLPQIFYTMTIAESRWKHLKVILENTDNKDSLPTNRPLHVYLHYHNKLTNLRNKLWKSSNLVQWGEWQHFFERDEFQNRGTIHTHGFAYTEKKIPELIASNTIRADIPDPILEPELYHLVLTYQIHYCDANKCGGPGTDNHPCKKGFPQPLSNYTYCKGNSKRYTYKRIKDADRWVVPYHPETLLLWEGHINFQYVTTLGFGKYVTKYATKAEPTEVFDIQDEDSYRKHVQARRLGAMELMILLLQYPITRSSTAVQYLPSAPSELRIRSVKPIYIQTQGYNNNANDDGNNEDEDENPYFDDAIDKYFERPNNDIFKNLTYPDYFRNYNIGNKPPRPNSKLYWTKDQKNRYVIQRTKPLLLRFTNYHVDDGEPYFYQHIIMKQPAYSERNLLGGCSSFRERFRMLYPIRYEQTVSKLKQSSITSKTQLSESFKRVIKSVLSDMRKNELWDIIYEQLISLERPFSQITSTLTLDNDQYNIYNTLTNAWGFENESKHPYFFMTGSAGTGKTFMTLKIVNMLNGKNIEYLLMAPTGVAAQNISGKTIHSTLRIRQIGGYYQTLSLDDESTRIHLLRIKAIIIDEISMVSSELFSFLSNLFATLHRNHKVFGGIPILVIGDLAQLPPVNGEQVFFSQAWKPFFPLFLTIPHRQRDDLEFYQLLQELRFGFLSEKSKQMINEKIKTSQNQRAIINSTHVVGIRNISEQINTLVCQSLPFDDHCSDPIISQAIDTLNHNVLDNQQSFRHYTNLPESITIQEGARVMFLNNKLIEHGICNGTIGVITKVINEDNVEVTFPTNGNITKVNVRKITTCFEVNGAHASRYQFPLQNAFALTAHKTQGVTLPHTTLTIDKNMFAPGQIYVAMSRAPSWDQLDIISFDFDCLKVDKDIVAEYRRLNLIHQNGLRSHIQ